MELPGNIIDIIEKYAHDFVTDIPDQKEYESYWTTPFPEGEQSIYMLTGNSDTSDFHTALYTIDVASYSGVKDRKFTCYQELAMMLYDHKNDEACDIFEDEDDYDYDTIKTPIELFTHLINISRLDPIIFVREKNPLLYWLMKKRRV